MLTGMTTPDCPICAFADTHHWWGPDLAPARSHCRDCHRSWASLVEGHCPTCHEHFANVKAFDAHLLEDGCRPPVEVIRKDGRPRLTTRTTRYGVTWRVAFYGTRPEFAGAPDLDDTDTPE